MGCDKFDLYLKEELTEKEFHAHMDKCQECWMAFETDKDLMSEAAALNTDLQVPDLWTEIRHEIILSPEAKDKTRFWPQTLIWSAAAALLFAVVFWAVSIREEAPTESRILSHQALEQVKTAEENYIRAIEGLEEIARDKLTETREPLAQLYRNKLKLIDAQINKCRNELERNPANAHIRNYLLAALQDMQTTLTEIIELKS